jgi:hypothetical protein
MNDRELAQALYQAGLLTQEQIQSAAAASRTDGRSFTDVIIQNDWVTPEQIAQATGGAVSAGAWDTSTQAQTFTPPPFNATPADTMAPSPVLAPPATPTPATPTPVAPIPEPSGYVPQSSYSSAPSYGSPLENTHAAAGSGQGANSSPLPSQLQGFSWAALLMSWIWGIAHNTWIAILALVLGFVPVIGAFASLGFCIWLGIKGNELAWQNRRWESIEQFRTVQSIWVKWGIGLLILSILLGILLAVFLFSVGSRIPAQQPQPGFGTAPGGF